MDLFEIIVNLVLIDLEILKILALNLAPLKIEFFKMIKIMRLKVSSKNVKNTKLTIESTV